MVLKLIIKATLILYLVNLERDLDTSQATLKDVQQHHQTQTAGEQADEEDERQEQDGASSASAEDAARVAGVEKMQQGEQADEEEKIEKNIKKKKEEKIEKANEQQDAATPSAEDATQAAGLQEKQQGVTDKQPEDTSKACGWWKWCWPLSSYTCQDLGTATKQCFLRVGQVKQAGDICIFNDEDIAVGGTCVGKESRAECQVSEECQEDLECYGHNLYPMCLSLRKFDNTCDSALCKGKHFPGLQGERVAEEACRKAKRGSAGICTCWWGEEYATCS